MEEKKHLFTFAVSLILIALIESQPIRAQISLNILTTPASAYGAGAKIATLDTSYYYLYPYNLHLTSGITSAVPLTVIDNNGSTVSGKLTFYGYDTSLISISQDGYVTALRFEGSSEIGTWVSASIDGVPVASTTIVRVLSNQHEIPFSQSVGENTVLYYPTIIAGDNISVYVTQYEIPTVNEYAYTIQAQLMGVKPFNGARQIFEVDFGETETQSVCGISGNPLRLGWNIHGNLWQNCFLFFPQWSPQWNVMYHEMGHNFTWASQAFGQGLGRFEYSEGLATAISIATIYTILTNKNTYPIGTDSRVSLQQQLEMVSNTMSSNFQNWLNSGADFSQLTPDIIDGIWLHYRSQHPNDFASRFFKPLQPQYSSSVFPILQNLDEDSQHTIFSALISAAIGRNLSDEFSNSYHYPINSTLFMSAYAVFSQIMGDLPQATFISTLVLSGDFAGSGQAGLLWQNAATGQVYGMLLNGAGIAQQGLVYTEPNTAWRIVQNGDLDGNGRDDLLWWNNLTGQVYWMPMNGLNIAGGSQIHQESNTAWQIVAVGDLNGDGKDDLIWWNQNTGQAYGMLMNGDARIQEGMIYQEPDTSWQILAARDFNGDGKADLLWRNVSTGQVYLMPMSGLTIAGGAMIYHEPNLAWNIVAVGDFNNDKRNDLVWWNQNTGQVWGMLMNGYFISSQGLFYHEPNTAWRIVSSGDYTGDGNADLLWRNSQTGQIYQMPMNGLTAAGGAVIYQEANADWRIVADAETAPLPPPSRSLPGAARFAPLEGELLNPYQPFDGEPVNPGALPTP